LLTLGIDLHLRNMAFPLSVDINSWTVEEVYAALGGEPYTIPFSDALGDASAHPRGSSHHPKHLVYPPTVPQLFALCNSSTPSIRIIDLSESFELLLSGQVLPGTPMEFAAPELLLNLPGEVSQSIGLWALGCCIFQFLSYSSLFCDLFGSLPFLIADIVAVVGGEKAIPERFRDAVRNSGALKYLGKATLRSGLDGRIKNMRGNVDDGEEDEEDDEDDQDTEDEEDEEYDEICPLDAVDGEVMLRVLRKMLVFDPCNRAAASTTVAIMSAAWNIHQCGCAQLPDEDPETSEKREKQEDTGLNNNA
jgi:serine/threonine protein kinase